MLELPDKILVSNQDIDMICKEAFEKNSLEKKFDLFLGLVIPAVISIVLDIFNYKTWGWTETVYTSVFACIIVYTIYLYRIKSKKSIPKQSPSKFGKMHIRMLLIRLCLLLPEYELIKITDRKLRC